MKKDVLILCQFFYPEYVSSATLPTELAEDLVKKGLSVGVLCGYPYEYYSGKPVLKKEIYKGIEIHRVKYTKKNSKSKFGRLINFFSLFLAFLLRINKIRKYKCVVVYSNPPIIPIIPYIVSKLWDVKFIFVAYDIYPDSAVKLGAIKNDGLISKIMNFINKRVYTNASYIIVLGNEMKDYLIRNNIAKIPGKIKVIPNWYDGSKLVNRKVVNKKFLDLRKKYSFIVLYSGNMGASQDMDTILQTMIRFKNNSKILFIFTGHGRKYQTVKEFIKRNSIRNAKMFGFLTGQDYSDVLNIADVCLVSLEKCVEGLGVPSKTYGYLAAGKPVIAIMSKDTDIAKVLTKYEAGKNIIQGEIKEFETILNELMKNRDLLEIYGSNARKIFEKYYDRNISTDQYYKLIINLIQKNSGKGEEYVQK